MAGRCTICSHISRQKIDELVQQGVALKHVAKKFRVTIPQLWKHNMRCADRKLPPPEVPQPAAPQPDLPLKAMLVSKLVEAARGGDTKAIMELLARPNLLEDPKPALTEADAWYELTKLLAAVEIRAMGQNAYWLRDRFNDHVFRRLELEGRHHLARRWSALSLELKIELWQSIVESLEEGVSDVEEAGQAVQ